MRSLGHALACALVACGVASAPALASAQPMVVVRAESRIELRVRRLADRVRIEGALRDDLGVALADRRIAITVTSRSGGTVGRADERTASDGSFAASFALPAGSYDVQAEFLDEAGYRGDEVRQPIDLDRAPVALRLEIADGGRLDLDLEDHEIVVSAESEATGVGLAIDLRSEAGTLATGTTDDQGRLALRIRSSELGGPGIDRLVVRSQADRARAAAQTEVPIIRFRATALTLVAETARVARGESAVFSGTLSDSRGGIARRAVGLWSGETHLATDLTDDRGEFTIEVPHSTLLGTSGEVVARFESDAPSSPSSESPAVRIEIASGARTLVWWAAALIAAAIAAALATRWRRAPAMQRTIDATRPSVKPSVALGARRGLRPELRGISARVIAARGEQPIAGAAWSLRAGELPIASGACDASGAIVIPEAPLETTMLIVEADGYEPVAQRISLPHRGELSGMTIRLRSLRDAALAPFRPVAIELLPSADLYTLWTARELIEAARRSGARLPTLPRLVEVVERAVYARSGPSVGDLRTIGELAAVVQVEIGAARAARSDAPNAR